MGNMIRLAALTPLLMLLSACLFTPGKFESTLDIRADRSFTFAYKGEVVASDMDKGGMPDFGPSDDDGGDQAQPQESTYHNIALMIPVRKVEAETEEWKEDFGPKADSDDIATKLKAVAEALSKENGFKSARYVGNHRIEVDYAISGRLDHSFVFPLNLDAQMIFPFIAIELRGNDKVRVKAPGFANESSELGSSGGMGGMGSSNDEASKALDGIFTITTDAEILSQNQEDGAQTVPTGKKIMWKVGPLTTTAPMAVLRLNPSN